MALLPSASVTIDDESGAGSSGAKYAYVVGCVGTSADTTPRVITSTKSFLDQYDYCPAADYIALHIEKTKKPVIFVGIPIATAGTIGRQNATGVVGNSVITVAAGTAGILEEVDAILTVTTGGTIAANGIIFTLSMDGGRTEKTIKLGTSTSYTVPYVGLVISFAAGTLIAGDVYTFSTTAPMWDSTGFAAARLALAAQTKLARSLVVIGDVSDSTNAGYVTTFCNSYETANDRFIYARVNTRDRLPLASMARTTVRMTGSPTLTFAEIGSGSDTITRSAGSFIADGFAVGMVITVAGSISNNVTARVTGVSALVLTLADAIADDLANEGPVSSCTIIGSHGLIFTTTTATRSGGSWLNDGFAVGDSVTFASTVSNNASFTITVLTATVMTFASGGTAEVVATRTATCTKGETKTAWITAMSAAMVSVSDQKRIDIAVGRARKQSPITGWEFRRPCAWAASIREYAHELHIPCWRKEDGVLDGWDLFDDDRNLYEFDERVDGGALAAGFTCFRTYANGPAGGTFIALSLTRALEGSILSRTHNMAVADEACAIVHAETEGAIGQSLVLKDNGTADEASLSIIEAKINTVLKERLLKAGPEGQIAGGATWRASRTDVLSSVPATLTGVLDLRENAALEQIETTVKVA